MVVVSCCCVKGGVVRVLLLCGLLLFLEVNRLCDDSCAFVLTLFLFGVMIEEYSEEVLASTDGK